MITSLKAAFKFSQNRGFMVSQNPNHVSSGLNILNKDYTYTSVDRVFNPYPQLSTNDSTYDNSWPVNNGYYFPNFIDGANGIAISSYTPQPNNICSYSLTDCHLSDFPMEHSYLSSLGTTAGRRYIMLPDSFCEVMENGELSPKAINGKFNYSGGPNAVNVLSAFIFHETETLFYLFHWYGIGNGDNFQIRTFNKATGTFAYYLGNNNGNNFGNGIFKYCGIKNNIALFIYTRMSSIAPTNNYQVSTYSVGYLFFDVTTNAVTYSTLHNPNLANTLINCGNPPSALTPDLSASGFNKFYVAGAKNTTECQVYRYRLTSTPAITETPNSTATLCTFTNLPNGTIIPCPTLDLTTENTGANTTATKSAEMLPLTVFNDSGEEYVIFLGKLNYQMPSTFTTFGPNQHSLTVFKVDPTNSSVLIFKNQIINNGFGTGRIFNGLIRTKNNKEMYLYNADGFIPMKWDDATENYIIGQLIELRISTMSIDFQNNLVVSTRDNMVYIFSSSSSFFIETKMENNQTQYIYEGTPITTNIVINVRDLFGNRVSKDISIHLSNMVFTSDSSSTKTITTSGLLDTVVPVTINSIGTISISSTI